LISKVSDSNFRLLTQASLSLKKVRSHESPE
jgi:hypothetical protein